MGILDGLLGMFGGPQQPQGGLLGTGGSNSLYGDLLTPPQQQALQNRASQGGLLSLANSGALDYTVPFISGKVPGGFAKGLAAYSGGMGEGEDKGILNALNAQLVGLKGQDLKSQLAIRRSMLDDLDKLVSGGPGPNTGGPPITPPGGGLLSGPAGGAEAVSSNTASLTLPAEARALLDSIAGPESSGSYNSRWPSKTFADYSDHPRIFEPGPEGDSSAAGRYQIVASTWDPVAQKLGLKDFKPESQDLAAWDLAQTEYNRKTGGDLLADLKAGKTDRVADALAGQWATLRRGISAYPQNLAKYMQGGPLQLAGDSEAGGTRAQPRSLADLANVVANLQPRQPQGGLLGYGGTDYPAPPGSPADKQSAADALVRTPHPELSAAFAKARNAGFNGTIEDFVRQATVQRHQGSLTQAGPQDTAAPQVTGTGAPVTQAQLGAQPGLLSPPAPQAAPQGGLLGQPAPQVVSPITMPQQPTMPQPSVGASPRVGGIDPLALARLGVKAELGGLGDVFKPLSSYYYQSPGYLQQAEGAKEGGKRAAGHPYDVALKNLELNGTLRNELAKTGMELRNGQIVPLQGFSETQANTAGDREAAVAGAQNNAQLDREQKLARFNAGLDPIKDRNKAAQKEFDDEVQKPFNAGQGALKPLTQIETATQNFTTGPGAATKVALARAWQSLPGIPQDSDLAKWIANGEIINKSGTTLGFELARTLGSREAQNIVQQAIAANPGLAVSPEGNVKLVGLIKQGIQRDFDKHAFYNQWFDKNGTYAGAGDAFNSSHPVEAYVSRIAPYRVKTPAEAAQLPPGTQFIDSNGERRMVPPRGAQ